MASTRVPPKRSARCPPNGRTNEPAAPPIAASEAASTFLRPYSSWKKIGRKRRQADEAAERHGVQARTASTCRPRPASRRTRRASGAGRRGRLLGQQAEGDQHEADRDAAPGPSRRASRRARPSRGASSAHATVPELPAPAMPIARPWYCGGYQRRGERQRDGERRARDAQQDADAEQLVHRVAPSQPHSSGSDDDRHRDRADPARARSGRRARRSVTRQTAADSSGTATSTPFSAAVSPRSSAMYAPSAPRITQIMKETSKWRRPATSEGVWPARRKSRIRMTRKDRPIGANLQRGG